jgi:DNA polymerase III alpha subunit
MIQPRLKNEWAPQQFGHQNVCNIGNYTTFGIRSSLIDMARVFGGSRDEVLAVTTNLELKGGDDEDAGDENGDLTWDIALKTDKKLGEYCERHPDVSDAASRLLERNRGRGKHAGGLIIANSPIDNIVPIMLDTGGNPVSAWTEGLHSQDLQPVGLIKFDVLVIKDLLRIAECCQLVKIRHGLDSICALPGKSDWTDTSYLEDPKALALADRGHTKGVFQFTNDGMQRMIRRGGVSSFGDLVAYTALIRPGPLGAGMAAAYQRRKKGEDYDIHPVLEPILGDTMGIFAYQEQIMKILNIVGKVPLIHCEKIRKAISKKDDKVFKKYRDQFIANAQKVLNWEEAEVVKFWDQIAKFYTYAFNKSHGVAYTYISSRLLYLKAHYPIEFYKTSLQYAMKDRLIRDFKREAENEGIEVLPIDLNKSKVTFNIEDNKIYIGFSNIKGIGWEPAEEIVRHQPYDGIEDFLMKFGTAAKVVKPLIHLGIFGDDIEKLMDYYESFKKSAEKINNRYKGNMKTRAKYIQQIKDLFPEHPDEETQRVIERIIQHDRLMDLTEDLCEYYTGMSSQFGAKDLWAIVKKYQRSVSQFEEKVFNDRPITLESFVPLEMEHDIPNKYEAEDMYYGFTWEHRIERSPDFTGKRFADLDDENIEKGPVEVMVIEGPRMKTSKKGNPYYFITVEDCDWNQQIITFWENDFQRFQKELEYWEKIESRKKGKDKLTGKGHMFKLVVIPPGPGFKSFTFYAPSKRRRKFEIPEDKNKDYRLIVMKEPDD